MNRRPIVIIALLAPALMSSACPSSSDPDPVCAASLHLGAGGLCEPDAVATLPAAPSHVKYSGLYLSSSVSAHAASLTDVLARADSNVAIIDSSILTSADLTRNIKTASFRLLIDLSGLLDGYSSHLGTPPCSGGDGGCGQGRLTLRADRDALWAGIKAALVGLEPYVYGFVLKQPFTFGLSQASLDTLMNDYVKRDFPSAQRLILETTDAISVPGQTSPAHPVLTAQYLAQFTDVGLGALDAAYNQNAYAGAVEAMLALLPQAHVWIVNKLFLTGGEVGSSASTATTLTALHKRYVDFVQFGYDTSAVVGVLDYAYDASPDTTAADRTAAGDNAFVRPGFKEIATSSHAWYSANLIEQMHVAGLSIIANAPPIVVPPPPTVAVCGNSIVETGEVCDDGNTTGGDYCASDCTSVTGRCSDGVQQTNEACDDGNTVGGDYCASDCTSVIGRCGDGVRQTNEACDDGNTTDDGNGCGATCQTSSTGGGGSGYLVFDHRHIALETVPASCIEQVKSSTSVFHYGHRSHGSQITQGARSVEERNATYNFEYGYLEPATGNALKLWDGMTASPLVHAPLYWSSEAGVDDLRSILRNNPNVRYTMWAWSFEIAIQTEAEVQVYLDTIAALELEFPDVTFVYMTGPAVDSTVNRMQRNQQIRDFCRTGGKVLYDFEDLDAWWGGEHSTQVVSGIEVPVEHSHFSLDTPGNVDYRWTHTTQDSCEQKAKAFWWMVAELEGCSLR